MNKDLIGTWLVTDTHVDHDTKLLLTESHRYFGKISDAMDNHIRYRNTQDLRFQFYSHEDIT